MLPTRKARNGRDQWSISLFVVYSKIDSQSFMRFNASYYVKVFKLLVTAFLHIGIIFVCTIAQI